MRPTSLWIILLSRYLPRVLVRVRARLAFEEVCNREVIVTHTNLNRRYNSNLTLAEVLEL